MITSLLTFLAFNTDSFASHVVNAEPSDPIVEEITDLTGTTWTWNESIDFSGVIDRGDKKSYSLTFSAAERTFDEIMIGYQYAYGDPEDSTVFYYSSGNEYVVYDRYKGVYDTDLATFTVQGGVDVENVDLINVLKSFATLDSTSSGSESSEGSAIYAYIQESFTSSMKVVGYDPEKDFLYASVSRIFSDGGYFASFRETSFVLQFVCYFVYANVIHIFVDVILFIPRLCHKWLKVWTQQED